jgi:alpha-glucosidase (family GH31 glycosyl hydrolase)
VHDSSDPAGALMVKSGAIIPTWPPCDHVERGWSPAVGLLLYPAARSSHFTLYEDDGTSLGYRQGEFAPTRLICETTGKEVTLTIGERQGSYVGMPATRDSTATIHLPSQPRSATLHGAVVTSYRWNKGSSTVTINIPTCGTTSRTSICQ